jgi:hypothetical protein
MNLADWTRRIAAIDARLEPIANRPLHGGPAPLIAPLEVAGVREETEELLTEIVAGYHACTAPEREAIRLLWEEHPSFAWAATFPFTPMTAARFRDHVTLFSISDHGRDTRDAMLLLDGLCDMATRAGADVQPALREVARLSSNVDKYGMGSTGALIRKHIR